MEVAESKGILFLKIAVNQDEREFITTLAEQELIKRAREKVSEFMSASSVKELVVGFDGDEIQVAVKL
jgi:hypothetical protein